MEITKWDSAKYVSEKQALTNAEIFVKLYVSQLHDTILAMFAKIVQIGDILEWAYEYHGATGNYQEWVKSNTGLSVDTAGNYRNVARNFRDLNPDVLKAGTLSQFYRLAFDTVDQSARDWFQDYVSDQLEDNNDYIVETGLEYVARYAPDHVKDRLREREINVAQAESLTRAYNDDNLVGHIARTCEDLKFSDGDVVLAFNRIFKDFDNAPSQDKPDKTWLDIHHNDFNLVWEQRDGTERMIFLPDATKSDWNAYMEYRQARRIQFNSPLRYAGKPNQIIRRNGKLVIEIPESVFSGDERDITEIELIVKGKPHEE